MQIGVVYPQTELGADPVVARDYVQAIEGMGYAHLAIYDHVLGADTTNRPDWRGPYTKDTLFHEPMVFYGYLAGLTTRLELVTSIIILPQRQTVLVAKQAAEIDVLSGGRLRFGIGLGWNEVEYEALGEDFHTRGRRVEEQVSVLRALWTKEVVNFEGRWHRIQEAGINPLPVQRPIPIWMGGGGGGRDGVVAETAVRRIARLADGWFPQGAPETLKSRIEQMRDYVREVGRDPAAFGIEARVNAASGTPEDWGKTFEAWQALGATHVGVNTMGGKFTKPEQHLAVLERFKQTVGLE